MFVVLAVSVAVSWVLCYRAWGTVTLAMAEHLKTLEGVRGHLETLSAGPERAFSIRILDLEDAVERLPRKWEDIKREALAAESRARAHIKRAQKELDERGLSDPGVDQLGRELSLLNGGGSEEGEVSAVPEDVALAPTVDAGPEGWAEIARNHKFGG